MPCSTENISSIYSGLNCHKELLIDLIFLDYLLLNNCLHPTLALDLSGGETGSSVRLIYLALMTDLKL